MIIVTRHLENHCFEYSRFAVRKKQLAHSSAQAYCSFKTCKTFSFGSICISDIKRKTRNINLLIATTYKSNPWKT